MNNLYEELYDKMVEIILSKLENDETHNEIVYKTAANVFNELYLQSIDINVGIKKGLN